MGIQPVRATGAEGGYHAWADPRCELDWIFKWRNKDTGIRAVMPSAERRIMAHYEHLPIYKAAFDLSVYFEKTVRNFSRYNTYTHGCALRNISREILMLIVRANNTGNKLPVLEEIRIKLEELKTEIRICKEVKVFPNFNSFQTSVNQVVQIAKQNEGWIKSLSGKWLRPDPPTDAGNRLGR